MKRFIIVIWSITCLSCTDFLNLKPDNKQVVYTLEDVKVSMSTYLWALCSPNQITVYFNNVMIGFPYSKRPCAEFCMYGDDIQMTKAVDNAYSRIYETNYNEDVNWEGITFSENFWQKNYLNIGYLNTVLHDLSNASDKHENPEEYERILGEARVFRAFYLFKLLQMYAPYQEDRLGIPVNLDADVVEGSRRLSQTEVYKILIGELTDVLAYEATPASWNAMYAPDIIHALLAQIYWFKAGSAAAEESDWENAEKYSGMVVENYKPIASVEDYEELFTGIATGSFEKNNTAALLKFGMYSNLYSFWGNATSRYHQRPVTELLEMFDSNDIRFQAFFKNMGTTSDPVYCVNKIRYDDDLVVLFRTDDMYLINAEANCHLQQMEKAKQVFTRYMNSKSLVYSSDGNLIEDIYRERRKEFCFEMDYRWLEMKRFGLAVNREALDPESDEVKIYSLEKDDYRYALPIPAESEMNYNDKMEQNPGWTF